MIGHDIRVTIVAVSADRIRIGIEAPTSIGIHREEVYIEIQKANVQAAASTVDPKKL